MGWRLASAAAVGATLAGSAFAQTTPPAAAPSASASVVTKPISEVDAARLLFESGRIAEAKKVLADLRRRAPDDPEVLFLSGLIAVGEKDYPTAVRDFRRILVHEPAAARVRLELARAFFLAKDYDNAERQFRLALAGDLPATARVNVAHYLYAIRQARSWSYNFSIAAAPDTDVNAGPTIQTIDIFGLPFRLSSQARAQSGVGLAVTGGGEWDPRLSPDWRLRLGGEAQSDDYRQGAFDDTTLSGFAGAQWVSGRWDVSPLATYYRRWYGGAVYNQGAGGALQATYYATPRLALSAALGGQYVAYDQITAQSGPAASANLGAAYTLSPTSFLTGQVAVARQWAGFAGYANTAVQLQLGYNRDLRGGMTFSLAPSWVRIGYDAPLVGFGATRVDNQWSVSATLLDRRIDLAGFTPRLAYTYTRNLSTVPLFSYVRNRIELGLTRAF